MITVGSCVIGFNPLEFSSLFLSFQTFYLFFVLQLLLLKNDVTYILMLQSLLFKRRQPSPFCFGKIKFSFVGGQIKKKNYKNFKSKHFNVLRAFSIYTHFFLQYNFYFIFYLLLNWFKVTKLQKTLIEVTFLFLKLTKVVPIIKIPINHESNF